MIDASQLIAAPSGGETPLVKNPLVSSGAAAKTIVDNQGRLTNRSDLPDEPPGETSFESALAWQLSDKSDLTETLRTKKKMNANEEPPSAFGLSNTGPVTSTNSGPDQLEAQGVWESLPLDASAVNDSTVLSLLKPAPTDQSAPTDHSAPTDLSAVKNLSDGTAPVQHSKSLSSGEQPDPRRSIEAISADADNAVQRVRTDQSSQSFPLSESLATTKYQSPTEGLPGRKLGHEKVPGETGVTTQSVKESTEILPKDHEVIKKLDANPPADASRSQSLDSSQINSNTEPIDRPVTEPLREPVADQAILPNQIENARDPRKLETANDSHVKVDRLDAQPTQLRQPLNVTDEIEIPKATGEREKAILPTPTDVPVKEGDIRPDPSSEHLNSPNKTTSTAIGSPDHSEIEELAAKSATDSSSKTRVGDTQELEEVEGVSPIDESIQPKSGRRSQTDGRALDSYAYHDAHPDAASDLPLSHTEASVIDDQPVWKPDANTGPVEVSNSAPYATLMNASNSNPQSIESLEPVDLPEDQAVLKTEQGLRDQVIDKLRPKLLAADLGRSEIRLELDPPELGSLQIEINRHGDSTSVSIETDNPVAQQILENNLRLLIESFEKAGIDLQDVDISQKFQEQNQHHEETEWAHQGQQPFGQSSPIAETVSGTTHDSSVNIIA